MPITAPFDPDALDLEAARLYDTAAWRQIVEGWQHTAPEPAVRTPSVLDTAPRPLLTKTVPELVDEALRALPAPPPAERPLSGRLGAILPDRIHTWRRIGQPDIKPSVQLGYARLVLEEWGWMNRPYKLRDLRGARCVCGAIITASRLGYGSQRTTEHSAAFVLDELRARGWQQLIGPWNRAPGRTAEQAIDLLDAAARRSRQAGH